MADMGEVYKVQIKNNTWWIMDGASRNAIAAEYDPGTQYQPKDAVFHNHTLYMCTASTTGTWNSSKWAPKTIFEIVAAMING